MGVHLNPYLHFVDTTRAAMEFYREVLGGTLNVMTFGDMGTEGPEATKVMHAQLETDGALVLMASDTPQGMSHTPGTSVSVSLSGDDAAHLRAAFAGLGEGGTVTVPLEKQMWGDEFGSLTDRFGVAWLVNIAGSAT